MVNFTYLILLIKNSININLAVNHHYSNYLLEVFFEYLLIILTQKINMNPTLVLLAIKAKINRVCNNRNIIKW